MCVVCCGCFDSLKLVKHEVWASVLALFSCSVLVVLLFGLFWYPFYKKTSYLPYEPLKRVKGEVNLFEYDVGGFDS